VSLNRIEGKLAVNLVNAAGSQADNDVDVTAGKNPKTSLLKWQVKQSYTNMSMGRLNSHYLILKFMK
jgi:hypothetical protein